LRWVFQVAFHMEQNASLSDTEKRVLVCETDQFFGTNNECFQSSFHTVFPKSDFEVVRGAKHFFFATQPERFNTVLGRFIGTLSGST